jgi:integrase
MREELKVASTTINTRIAAVRKFYDCNDIELKWKKIKSYVGRARTTKNKGKKDRPYTSLEILKMLEKADERGRAIILLMASTGMRAEKIVEHWDQLNLLQQTGTTLSQVNNK